MSDVLGDQVVGARRAGIEQEFFVVSGSERVDFACWIRSGSVSGRRLDPADPHAHRQSCGGVITADGHEAEIATPPAALLPGFTGTLSASLSRLADRVRRTDGVEDMQGASTHLNVEVHDGCAVRTARRFSSTHAGAMMLLLDRRDSPGLLVRPRSGRLELGGEYATGRQLQAATVFAAAAGLHCEKARFARPLARPRLEAAVERYGWYVDRRAFGADLYSSGRRTKIGANTGQDLLDWSWTRVRPIAETIATTLELDVVDAAIEGRHPLPCEEPDPDPSFAPTPVGTIDLDPAHDITMDRRYGDVSLSTVLATWDHVVVALTSGEARRYVGLPAHRSALFLTAFSAGLLAEWCAELFAVSPHQLPVLVSKDDVGAGAAFGAVAVGAALTPAERDPVTGRMGGMGSGPSAREHKQQQSSGDGASHAVSSSASAGRVLRPWQVVAATSAAVAAITVAVVAVANDNDGGDPTAVDASREPSAASSVTIAPADSAADEVARALGGTYDVTTTVTEGNPNIPVGQVTKRVVPLSLDCDELDGCSLAIGDTTGAVAGGSVRFTGTATEPCPTKPGVSMVDAYILVLTPNKNGFSGTQRIRTLDPERCNSFSDPITLSWVGVRRTR
ncbi:MAG: hypothetical protein ACR2JT_03600 [Nocardioidaceae bacterium]